MNKRTKLTLALAGIALLAVLLLTHHLIVALAVLPLVGLTIASVVPPNAPLPVNSYGAHVIIADGDASPAVVPIGAALQAKIGATNPLLLKYKLTPLVIGAGTAGLSVVYDGAGNLDITHATGGTTGCTVYVEVAIPTTNNAP